MLCLSFVLLTLMQSGLGMVTETTQNVYDELKAKKTPGDNWFGFGFAFFLGWSHIPAPHLKGRSRNERLFCFALLYIRKTAERVWYAVKYLVMENMLMWGGIKDKERNPLKQRGGTVRNQSESKCILWRLLGSEGLSSPGGSAVTLWTEANFHSFQFLSSLLIRKEANGAVENN